jgi:protein-tyrosine phosphatase
LPQNLTDRSTLGTEALVTTIAGIEVLLVCTGNQCRTPMAEGLLRFRAARSGVDLTVTSVGLLGDGVPASAHAVDVLAARGIDIAPHRSRQLDRAAIDKADLVLGMARRHVREVVLLDADALGRTFTLKELVRLGREHGARRDDESVASWLERIGSGRTPPGLVGELAADDVADPIGGPRRGYERCATELDELLAAMIELAFPAPTSSTARKEQTA